MFLYIFFTRALSTTRALPEHYQSTTRALPEHLYSSVIYTFLTPYSVCPLRRRSTTAPPTAASVLLALSLLQMQRYYLMVVAQSMSMQYFSQRYFTATGGRILVDGYTPICRSSSWSESNHRRFIFFHRIHLLSLYTKKGRY